MSGRLEKLTRLAGSVAGAEAGADRVEKEDRKIEMGLQRVFAEAAAVRASDVMFEREKGGECKVYAIVNDRKLRVGRNFSEEEGRRVMGRVFHVKEEGSAQTSYQEREFQGFSVRAGKIKLPATVSGLRCQRGPHEPDGDHLVARLFYRDVVRHDASLEGLGFQKEESEAFAEIRMGLFGGVFVGGSTGDGKTTTLATNLMLQMREWEGQLNLVTIEDPVEIVIPGALQIAVPTSGVGEDRGQNFEAALMHFCRIHPASGMVSEIRDVAAARQVLQFIDTGHQVWTTIHVRSANAILFRLVDMGVGVAEVCKPGNIQLLMKQTLVPRLCGCSLRQPQGREVPDWLAVRLRGWPEVRFRNVDGCEKCAKDNKVLAREAWGGYQRPTVVAEMIRPDGRYLEFVRERNPIGAWDYWRSEMGGRPIGEKIWDLVRDGVVDPFDAMRKGAKVEEAKGAKLRVVADGGAE